MHRNYSKRKATLADRTFAVLRSTVLIIFLILNLFPLFWVLMSSFKTNKEILDFALALPKNPSFKNYARVFQEPDMIRSFVNSAVATVISVTLNLFAAYMTAYAISRYRFRFLRWFMLLLSFGLLVPINSALLPIKMVMDRLHLSNSVIGLGILYAAMGIPTSTLILESHMGGIPKVIDEAAWIDGASPFKTATAVVAPIARTGMVSVLILQAVFSWNEFLFAMTLISDQSKKTMQIISRNFLGVFQANYGALFASVVLAVIPMVIVFVVFQDKVIDAFTSGAVKQ